MSDYLQSKDSYVTASPQLLSQDFLNHVAAGRQDEAEAMLKKDPRLALFSGTVTDHANRTFRNITGFQYAVWSLDWHMWRMIKKYLPPEEARLQAESFATGSWVKEHGEHANWYKLIENYQTLIDNFSGWYYNGGINSWEKINDHLIHQIGSAQSQLPMHVIQEYCQPSRQFSWGCVEDGLVPSFKEDIVLVRKLPEWLDLKTFGREYIIWRADSVTIDSRNMLRDAHTWDIMTRNKLGLADKNAIAQLYETRTQQRQELVVELKDAHTPAIHGDFTGQAPQSEPYVQPLLWHALCSSKHEPFVGHAATIEEAGQELVATGHDKHNGPNGGRITPILY